VHLLASLCATGILVAGGIVQVSSLRAVYYTHGSRVDLNAQASTAVAEECENLLSSAADAPLLIMTDSRVEQLRRRQDVVEITYGLGRVVTVIGRQVTVATIVLPLSGDLPLGTVLYRAAGGAGDALPWNAVHTSRSLQPLRDLLRDSERAR
jgi:hypothetical protein